MALKLNDTDEEDGLPVWSTVRCMCQIGLCTNRAGYGGLCDRCLMEYAAFRNVYLKPEEWH